MPSAELRKHEPIPPLGPRDTQDRRGRVRTYTGAGDEFSNSGRWQWRSRLVVQRSLGRKLHSSEHVHHLDGNRANDQPCNLAVVLADYHGQYHGIATVAYRYRDELGRFVCENPLGPPHSWPRLGPILGPAAKERA